MSKDKRYLYIIVAVLAVTCIVITCVFFYTKNHSSSTAWKYAEDIQDGVLYPVARVIDGDTLVADVSGHDLTVRLIGIDTPETVDPRKPVQCFGPEASEEAKKIFASSRSIYLEKDSLVGNYDKYGRVLAYVYLSDHSLYNEFMVQSGFAREYTYFKQSYKYQQAFKQDQKVAKKEHLGLWASCSS